MNRHYHINLFWSDEDQSWIADVPDLTSCSSHGDSPTEALAEIELAIDAWIEVAQKSGFEIPPPRYRPTPYAKRTPPTESEIAEMSRDELYSSFGTRYPRNSN